MAHRYRHQTQIINLVEDNIKNLGNLWFGDYFPPIFWALHFILAWMSIISFYICGNKGFWRLAWGHKAEQMSG